MPPETSEAREPCPRCGEPTPLVAQICAHCRGSLLVDVVLLRPLGDPRRAYQLARELHQADRELDFAALKRGFEKPGQPVLAGVHRLRARQALDWLRRHEVEGQAIPQQSRGPVFHEPPARRRPSALWLLVILAGVGVALQQSGLLSFGSGELQPETEVLQVDLDLRQVADLAIPSTATIECPESQGAGFFIDPEVLVTNHHVLCPDSEEVRVRLYDGRSFTGRTVRGDAWLDYAVVQVPGANATPLSMGDATTVQQGDEAVMIGNPQGLDFTLHSAVVSRMPRRLSGVAYIQIDANVNPGNSGGPLLDGTGRVLGIVSMKAVENGDGLGLVLPINYLYEGSEPAITRPGEVDTASWNRIVTATQQDNERQVAEVREKLEKPLLLSVRATAPRALKVALLRVSGQTPWPQSIQVEIHRDARYACTSYGEVTGWSELPGQAAELQDGRQQAWLERNGLNETRWLGTAAITLDDACPSIPEIGSGEIIVPAAQAPFDRVTIEPPSVRPEDRAAAREALERP